MTRRALVLGCGGTIGGAWAIAVLAALSDAVGIAPFDFDILQGTSAGAEIVTMLGGGASIADLVAMQRGESTDPRLRAHLAATPPSLPPLPAPGLLNPRLLRSQRGLAACSGVAPTGRADASWLQRLAEGFTTQGRLAHPACRMVAFDVAAGRRVVFGSPRAPQADVGAALRASWAIPGWLPPVTIGGRRYVDGGVASTASVDLISPDEADVVYVIAPMASAHGERAPGLGGLLENTVLRRPMSRMLDAEVATVGQQGATVVVITPGRHDLTQMGANFMNRRHRRPAFDAAMISAPTTVGHALAATAVRS